MYAAEKDFKNAIDQINSVFKHLDSRLTELEARIKEATEAKAQPTTRRKTNAKS